MEDLIKITTFENNSEIEISMVIPRKDDDEYSIRRVNN